MMNLRTSRAAFLALALIAACIAAATTLTPRGTSDSRQTALGPADYEFDGPPEPAVVGRFTSKSDSDMAMRLTLFRTPASTGIEEKESIVETKRTEAGAIILEGAATASDLAEGDRVRALYEAFDARGIAIWSSERHWTQR